MAILSKGIKLSYGTPANGGGSVTYTDLTNLTEIPALGGTPEKVDTTTLADANKHYINGIKDYGDLSFKFFYDKALLGASHVSFHPCDNSATLVIRVADFQKFINIWGGEAEALDMDNIG